MVTNRQYHQLNTLGSSRRYQQGMSLWGLLIVVIMAGTLGFVGLKLFPVYKAYWTLTDIARDMMAEPGGTAGGRSDMNRNLLKRMHNNGIWDLDASVIQIVKNPKGGVNITVDYEQRIHLFFNLDMVAVFYKEI